MCVFPLFAIPKCLCLQTSGLKLLPARPTKLSSSKPSGRLLDVAEDLLRPFSGADAATDLGCGRARSQQAGGGGQDHRECGLAVFLVFCSFLS